MKTLLTSLVYKFSILLLWVTVFSCETPKEGSQDIIGEWKVQWVTYPDKNTPVNSETNLTMNGKMDIQRNGKITISAYGYENCIFGKDTLIHTLNWELEGDTLNVKNEGDEFGMPYLIVESSEEKIKLKLVEDVFLFLTK